MNNNRKKKIIGWIDMSGNNRCLACDDGDGNETITVADLEKAECQIKCDICGHLIKEDY
ncbi:MAG: hypothetical protein Q7K65_02325 [Candidatus Buchananbacteria bacterium]|nr:hypothetical protein [Candidatus Buchananbacteria bacterium]